MFRCYHLRLTVPQEESFIINQMTNGSSEAGAFVQCLIDLVWIWTNCTTPTALWTRRQSRSGTMTSRIRQAHHYNRGLPNTLQFQETQVRLLTKLFPLDLVLAVAPKLAPSPRSLSTFSQASTFSYVYVILPDKSVCQLVNNY